MYGRKWFKVFIIVLYVAGIAYTDPGKEALQELTQDGSEIILSTQTTLRKYLVSVLTDIRNKIPAQTIYSSTVSDVVKGLLTRDLDPLKVINILNSNQSSLDKLVKIINSFRECGQDQISFSNWYSFLQTIPDVDALVPPPPAVSLEESHWQVAQRIRSPYASAVVSAIEENYLKLTLSLFQNILFNFPFGNFSPDLDSIVNNVIHSAELEQINFQDYQSTPNFGQTPSEILRKILNYIARKQNVGSRLSNQSIQLLAVLNDVENVKSFRNEVPVWNYLENMNEDDYPPDVIHAKNELVLALKENRLGLDENRLDQELKGYSQMEKTLALISRLTFIPNENPFSGMIYALYPHIKLRYLSNNERYFQPHTSGDIAFLLNSFLTVDNKMNPSLIKEIHNIFLLPDFPWARVLKDFDYSRYSKPRTMMLDILQELLNNADKLPPCEIILFSYFIRNNTQVPGCSTRDSVQDLLTEKLSAPTTPISIVPSFTQTSTVPVDTTTTTTMATNLPQMKQCPNGEASKFIDPESIVDIINTPYHTNFIKNLIRYNPMPAEIYSDTTRLAIYRKVLENLKNNKYNDEVTGFVIGQAILRIPLNEKRDLPPNYVYLCPSEVSEMESKAPIHSPPSDAAMSALIHKTTTTSSIPVTVESVSQPVTMPPNPVAVQIVAQPVTMPPNPNPPAVGAVSQPITMLPSPATAEAVSQPVTVPPLTLSPCENPVSVIDRYSIIEIANEDPNYERIKYLVNSAPMFYENYKHLTTREGVLREVLEEKKRNTNNPVEKYDITQVILRLKISQDGQLEPLVLQECSLNSIYEAPVLENCPPERRLIVISPQELLDVIEPKFHSQFLEGLITSRPILWESYGQHPTRKDVLRTLLQHRTLEMTQNDVTQNLGVNMENIPINSNANLPPTAVTICQEDETTTVSTVEFPVTTVPGRQCNELEELKTVIDPYCLLEIIDDGIRERVEELVFSEPILADKYLILGSRANVLSHFLRQHYAGCNGHITDPELMRISSGLLINDKGILPPLVRDECLIVSKSKVENKQTPTGDSGNVQTVTQPQTYAQTTASVSVDSATPDHLQNNNFQQVPIQSNMTSQPVPLTVPEIGNTPPNVVETTSAVVTVDTPSCSSNEILTMVYDTNTVFDALDNSAPHLPYIREGVTTYLIPVEQGKTYSKVEILEMILNAILKAAKDEKIVNNVNVLKTHLLYEGPGLQVPGVVNVCLTNADMNEEMFVDECMANETVVLVVNTDSLLDALGPGSVYAPYVKAQIKNFVIPIDIPKSFTKAEVLKDVLAHMEGSVSDAGILQEIELVRKNVLETGRGLQEPDVVQVCMPNTLMESGEQESNSAVTGVPPEAFTQTAVAATTTTPLPQAPEYTPNVPFSQMAPSGAAVSTAVESQSVPQPSPPNLPPIYTITTTTHLPPLPSPPLPAPTTFAPLPPPPPPTLPPPPSPSPTTNPPPPPPTTFAPPPPMTTLAPLPPPPPPILPPSPPPSPTTNPPPPPPSTFAPPPPMTTLAPLPPPPPPTLPPPPPPSPTTNPPPPPPTTFAPPLPMTTLAPLPPPPPPTLPPPPPPSPTTNPPPPPPTTFAPPPPMTTLAPLPPPPPPTLPPPPPPSPTTNPPPPPPTTFAPPPPMTTLAPLPPMTTLAPLPPPPPPTLPATPPPSPTTNPPPPPPTTFAPPPPMTTLAPLPPPPPPILPPSPPPLSITNPPPPPPPSPSPTILTPPPPPTTTSPPPLPPTTFAPPLPMTTLPPPPSSSLPITTTLPPYDSQPSVAVAVASNSAPSGSSATESFSSPSLPPAELITVAPLLPPVIPLSVSQLSVGPPQPVSFLPQPSYSPPISLSPLDLSTSGVRSTQVPSYTTPPSQMTPIDATAATPVADSSYPQTAGSTVEDQMQLSQSVSSNQAAFSTPPVSSQSFQGSHTNNNIPASVATSAVSQSNPQTEVHNTQGTTFNLEQTITQFTALPPSPYSSVQAETDSHNHSDKQNYLPSGSPSLPTTVISQASTPSYSSDTSNLVLTITTTGSPIAYLTDPYPAESDMLNWPIILKPNLNKTCYDKINLNYTIPIQIVNVTSLFEVLVGEVSPLDKYLTTTYLTSLDSYYKLYDFAIETYRYKNTFLHDVLNHLLSFHRNLETDKHIRRILEKISFTNNAPLRSIIICNQRIYDDLPKPAAKFKRHLSEIFFTYETSTPCQSNGSVTYNIGTSLKNDMPLEVVQALTEFLTYASRQNLFEGVAWEDLPTQRELVNLIVSTFEKQKMLNENQRQAVDYLYDHLKCDVLRFVRPTVEKSCLVRHDLPPHFMNFVTDDICQTGLFAPTKITYYVDVFSLLKTVTNVQPHWIETLVPLLSNSKLMQKINLSSPFVVGSKGEFLREILRRLGSVRDESLPISTMYDILKSVDVFGYGSTPVETISDCPNRQTNHTSSRFVDKATAAPCNITQLPATKMSRFIHIPTLLDAFHKNTSRKMLAPLRHILGQPNAYTILPNVENINYSAVQFLQEVLNNLKAHSTSVMGDIFNALMTQLNMNYQQGLVVEKVCQNPMNTNGEYLMYPTAESCDSISFDVDVSKLLENFHANISLNQIIALGSHVLTKNQDFYQLLYKVNPSGFNNYADFLRAFIETSKTGPLTPAANLLSTLSSYIKNSQPLTVLTNCVEGPMNLAAVISDDRLQHIVQNEDELSFRSFEVPDTGLSDERLKETENMVLGERKLKENLYSLLGDQDKYIKQLQVLERSNLTAENMYRNFDVIEVLPNDVETELLLRRYQNMVDENMNEETTEAVQDVLDFLTTQKASRRKREAKPAKFSFDLLKMMEEYKNTPEDLLEKAKTLSLNLEAVTENTDYEDILPHIETLKPKEKIMIVIRMAYISTTSPDSEVLRQIYNFFAPVDELMFDVEGHYNNVIDLLHTYIKDPSVNESKNLLTKTLEVERYEDRSIRKVSDLSNSPKEFLVSSLRRFRKIVNKKLSPEAVSVWMATNKLLKHLQVPVNDISEARIDEDLDVIEFFRTLNGPVSVMKSKAVVLKHVIDNKKKLEDVFDGLDDIENFADEEKILIIVKRLLNRTEEETKNGQVLKHLEALSDYITSLGYEIKERPLEGSYVGDLIQKALDESSFNDTDTVRAYLSKAMSDRPELFENVFRSLVIADYETPQQQLSEVLRQVYRMYSPKLGNDLLWAINSSFFSMNTSLTESSEDKFSGDFVDWMSALIRQSLPNAMGEALENAYDTVVEVLEKRKVQLPKAMKGIRLFTHPKDLRGRIVVLSLKGLEGLSEDETNAIKLIWEYLDVTEDEVLDETINQSQKASDVLTSVLPDVSENLVKSQQVIISYLMPKRHQKLAYKGIRNTMKKIDVLVKLLDNIAKSLNKFEDDLLVAGNSLLKFLEIPVLASKPDEKNRHLKIISELENIFENSNDEIREAVTNLTTYIRTYPSTFEKIIATMPSDENAENMVPNILQAVQNYEMPISSRARTSASILDDFLKKDVTLLTIKSKRSKSNESELNEAEVGKFEALKEASLRFLTSYSD